MRSTQHSAEGLMLIMNGVARYLRRDALIGIQSKRVDFSEKFRRYFKFFLALPSIILVFLFPKYCFYCPQILISGLFCSV
jgi:hypothetical protein